MIRPVKIQGRPIGPDNPCYIVAEISANHNQSYEKAERLIELAKKAGADAVKLQTYTPDTMTIDCDNKYFRIKDGPWKGQTLYQLYKKAYTPWEWHAGLKKRADALGITFFSTPFDATSADFLEQLGVPAYKIASFEIVDIPLIRHVAAKGKPIIVSTGMATLDEVAEAVKTIKAAGNDKIILLKCTSGYPALPEEMNLVNIDLLSTRFKVPVGLSDHSMDSRVVIAATAMGICLIEKHLTEKRSDGGPDAGFSLEPHEFKRMVEDVRITGKTMGKKGLRPSRGESQNLLFRRSLFAVANVKKGERFTGANVRSIRPGNGLKPAEMGKIIGRRAAADVGKGTPIAWKHVAQ